jgi:hypothetical protein
MTIIRTVYGHHLKKLSSEESYYKCINCNKEYENIEKFKEIDCN